LVLDRGRGAEALFNYYELVLVGRAPLRCAVVDFIGVVEEAEDSLPLFISSCLAYLRTRPFDVALTLGPPVTPAPALFKGGFLPLPAAQSMIFLPVTTSSLRPSQRSLLVHWR
jgi:hypothetical protein